MEIVDHPSNGVRCTGQGLNVLHRDETGLEAFLGLLNPCLPGLECAFEPPVPTTSILPSTSHYGKWQCPFVSAIYMHHSNSIQSISIRTPL